jgi:hypothetical protein
MIRSPTYRIIVKDLRRFRPLLVSAAALDILGVLMPFGITNPGYFGGMTTPDAVTYVRWLIVAFVCVALAQDDGPSGDRGSWLARPITPGNVLGAKVGVLVGGLALPAGLAAVGAAVDGPSTDPNTPASLTTVKPFVEQFLFCTYAFVLWPFFAIGLHEIAHAVMGRIVGFRPFLITMGQGPRIFSGHLLGVEFRIHLAPMSGRTHASFGSFDGLRWRGALFVMAGPASDLLLLSAVWALLRYKGSLILRVLSLDSLGAVLVLSWDGVLGWALFFEVMVLVFNLLPYDAKLDRSTSNPTDGKQLILYLSGRISAAVTATLKNYREEIARYDPTFRAGDSWIFKASQVSLAKLAEAQVYYLQGRFGPAVGRYLGLLETEELSRGERAQLLDQLASIAVIGGDKAYLERALAWSREACELAPGAKTLRGTLGSLLVETGSYAAGIEMLMPLTSPENEPIDRSISSSTIGKAYFHLGEKEKAASWLRIGHQIGFGFGVSRRIAAETGISLT